MSAAEVVVGHAQWAESITSKWRSSVESILEVGRLLLDAKAALPHGEFEAMVKSELPFGPRSARMLAAVARNPTLSNRKYTSDLPASWYSLYELSRLPATTLDAAFEHGLVHPELKQAEARQLSATLDAPPLPPETHPTCTSDDLDALQAESTQFGTIYADPPWQYGNQATRASTGNHYETLPVDDICALPIGELAAENSHLHLWTTNAFLEDAFRVIRAWGFEYKSCFLWVKPTIGIGNYWRVSHEFLLLGIRGSCPFLDRAQRSWLQCGRGAHSSKPEQVRDAIEKVSPGPRLELFARRVSPGWTSWGNEIDRDLFYQAHVVAP